MNYRYSTPGSRAFTVGETEPTPADKLSELRKSHVDRYLKGEIDDDEYAKLMMRLKEAYAGPMGEPRPSNSQTNQNNIAPLMAASVGELRLPQMAGYRSV
jgi:hypothetical protein